MPEVKLADNILHPLGLGNRYRYVTEPSLAFFEMADDVWKHESLSQFHRSDAVSSMEDARRAVKRERCDYTSSVRLRYRSGRTSGHFSDLSLIHI